MPTAENPAIETASSEYLGRWNRLVSTTNWEKGRIVAEWREALIEAGAPAAAYTRRGLEPAGWQRHAPAHGPLAAGLPAVCIDAGSVSRLVLEPLPGRPGLGRRRDVAGRGRAEPLVDFPDAGRAVANARRPGGRDRGGDGGRGRRRRRRCTCRSAAGGEFRLDGRSPRGGRRGGGRPRLPAKVPRSMGPIPSPATSRRRFDRSKTCLPCPPIYATPSTASSWRSSTIGSRNWQEVSREDVLATLEALRQLTLAEA